jgi:hypothetical protein
LRLIDPFWESVEQAELAESLHPYWRNAGKWRLAAENGDALRAAQAAATWREVVIEHIDQATIAAQNIMLLDFHLRSITNAHAQAQSQVAALAKIRDHLREWQTELASAAPDQAVAEDAHWLTWYAFTQVGLSPGWTALLQAYPALGAPVAEYRSWLAQAIPAMEEEIQVVQAQAEALGSEADQVLQQYSEASRLSMGISANLQVEEITDQPPEIRRLRPVGLLMLIGSCLGLAAWLVWEMLQIARRQQP